MSHNPQFLALVDDARARITEWTVAETQAARERGESFELIDVREQSEWAASRIAGARYIGRGVLERDAEQLLPDPDATIVLYCGGGYRSALAADALTRMGYRHVISMDGGIRGWREAGLPIDTAPATADGG
jgi:rhodanese-related sulfurtransferase